MQQSVISGRVGARAAREIKRAPRDINAVTGEGVFEGYASIFGLLDLAGDIVAPGAFADTLKAHGAAGVRMLWQHDPAEPIGTWLSIAEDTRGLRVRGKLNLDTARGREALALMRDGALDGLSIGVRTERAVKSAATGARVLQKIDLWEISLVTFPAMPRARVEAMKQHAWALSRAERGRGNGIVQGSLAARLALFETRYSPNQPRVPAGSGKESGQWTSGDSQLAQMTPECKAEWATARATCLEMLIEPNPPRSVTGGYKDIHNCARGLVSEACGGNKVEYQ